MTREHVKALLPVLQAYAEGKEILVDGRPACRPTDLDFNCRPWEYSIKPEPLEIEVWVHPESGELQGAWTGVDPAGMKHLGFSKKKFIELME